MNTIGETPYTVSGDRARRRLGAKRGQATVVIFSVLERRFMFACWLGKSSITINTPKMGAQALPFGKKMGLSVAKPKGG